MAITTTAKQKRLTHLFSILGKGARADSTEQKPVLEQFIYAVCREGTTRDLAEQAYKKLLDGFFDWNEIRVSSVHELAEALSSSLPDAETRRAWLDPSLDTQEALSLCGALPANRMTVNPANPDVNKVGAVAEQVAPVLH